MVQQGVSHRLLLADSQPFRNIRLSDSLALVVRTTIAGFFEDARTIYIF